MIGAVISPVPSAPKLTLTYIPILNICPGFSSSTRPAPCAFPDWCSGINIGNLPAKEFPWKASLVTDAPLPVPHLSPNLFINLRDHPNRWEIRNFHQFFVWPRRLHPNRLTERLVIVPETGRLKQFPTRFAMANEGRWRVVRKVRARSIFVVRWRSDSTVLNFTEACSKFGAADRIQLWRSPMCAG